MKLIAEYLDIAIKFESLAAEEPGRISALNLLPRARLTR
jgi:hypothetical protein